MRDHYDHSAAVDGHHRGGGRDVLLAGAVTEIEHRPGTEGTTVRGSTSSLRCGLSDPSSERDKSSLGSWSCPRSQELACRTTSRALECWVERSCPGPHSECPAPRQIHRSPDALKRQPWRQGCRHSQPTMRLGIGSYQRLKPMTATRRVCALCGTLFALVLPSDEPETERDRMFGAAGATPREPAGVTPAARLRAALAAVLVQAEAPELALVHRWPLDCPEP